MTNTELIQKIKSYIEDCLKEFAGNSQFERGERYGYNRLISFLSTLESETKEEEKVPTRIYLGSKYEFIRKDILLNEIEELKKNNEVSDDKEYASYELDVACGYDMACDDVLSFLDTLQESENPKDLQSLINEASKTAQRIIDRHSFYASLPDNLRHKYTEGSWFEILDAISKYGKQEPEVDLEEEIDRYFYYEYTDNTPKEVIARHFAQWGAENASSSSEIPNDLEEAADELALRAFPEKKSYSSVYDRVVDYNAVERKNYRDGIIAGAKWQAEHASLPEDTVIYNKGVEEGKRLMMEEAVEKTVFQITKERTPVIMVTLDANEYKNGDKVYVIVIPNTDKK